MIAQLGNLFDVTIEHGEQPRALHLLDLAERGAQNPAAHVLSQPGDDALAQQAIADAGDELARQAERA
ncbi:hypothetical protein C7450_101880 [Chelatococcus asaccharovorans]|uniref:Uncharacterized protein n=1 Tax=Chelatococcus asaccharovorans TaxID=28210 RepID=A0A2V3UJV1_9HYPH|nr:hypothetical protein C7450_101880 [Chelatococcus asaccharovorans]